MKTKVMILLPALLPGGAEMLVRNLVCSGFKREFDIVVCCLGIRRKSFLERDIENAGIKIHFLGQKSLVDMRVLVRLYRMLKFERPDVIHTHLNSLVYSLLPVYLAGVQRRIHTVHNIAKNEGKVVLRIITFIAFRLCGYLPIGISKRIGESIKSFYGVNNISIINNGIPVDLYEFNENGRCEIRKSLDVEDNEFVCIHIGRFVEQKNHVLLIKAFILALKNYPKLRLILIGSGRLEKEIHQLVIRNRIENRVTFLGTRSDISALLSAADAFVFSSKWEGLPLTVIEAMSSGLPVISTDVGGISDLVRDGVTGYLVSPGDAQTLSERITELASDTILAENIGRSGRQWVRQAFDIRNAVLCHEALYRHGVLYGVL